MLGWEPGYLGWGGRGVPRARGVRSLWGARERLTWPQGLGMLKPGSLTTHGREAVRGPCAGRAAESLVVPQRLLGCPAPPVRFGRALRLPGHRH